MTHVSPALCVSSLARAGEEQRGQWGSEHPRKKGWGRTGSRMERVNMGEGGCGKVPVKEGGA